MSKMPTIPFIVDDEVRSLIDDGVFVEVATRGRIARTSGVVYVDVDHPDYIPDGHYLVKWQNDTQSVVSGSTIELTVPLNVS